LLLVLYGNVCPANCASDTALKYCCAIYVINPSKAETLQCQSTEWAISCFREGSSGMLAWPCVVCCVPGGLTVGEGS
jgi:hypothetical protein